MRVAARALALLLLAVPEAAMAQACRPDRVHVEGAGRVASFSVEIADTPESRARGLMFRDDLRPDQGMLFLFDAVEPVAFWMKDTPLSLDMLFIDGEGRVCGIEAEAEPFSLDPRPSGCAAAAVLEIRGGLAERHGIRPGARMRHPFFGDGAAWPCG